MEFSKFRFKQRANRFREEWRKAFSLNASSQPFTSEEERLLEKMATVVVNRKMATPTLLFLESMGPMNFLGSQALHFLTPIISLAVPAHEMQQAAILLERRDTLPRLICLIETKAQSGNPLTHDG